jgi:hypothetical protein
VGRAGPLRGAHGALRVERQAEVAGLTTRESIDARIFTPLVLIGKP